jgi:hypothetical protein
VQMVAGHVHLLTRRLPVHGHGEEQQERVGLCHLGTAQVRLPSTFHLHLNRHLIPSLSLSCYRKIPKLKRKLGGKRAFHEKIVIDRSKKFHDKLDQLMLPPFELLYIWNMFHMMAHEPKLLMPMLEEVENKLKTVPNKSGKFTIKLILNSKT